MSYGTRIAAVLFGLTLGLASSGLAHATIVGGNSGPGTWTYNFDLGNGASFQMTMNGAFGVNGSATTGYGFTGIPAGFNGYVNDPSITFTGNNTYHYVDGQQVVDGGFDVELNIQYDVASGDYSSTLDYTFVEPTSFWENTGSNLVFDTGDGEFIRGLQEEGDPNGPGTFGEVGEGANFATFSNTPGSSVTLDPPCNSCVITTTFTPLVSPIPEPSTFTLLGTGVAAVFAAYRRRRIK